jgi:2-polyprenyl-3-methyl-5-hydroxy-6-metoxy-1,4-benzoquinol methylase
LEAGFRLRCEAQPKHLNFRTEPLLDHVRISGKPAIWISIMDFPELGSVAGQAGGRSSVWERLDSYVGRGSYHRLRRWLDPGWKYSAFAYAEAVDDLLKPGMRWLDAGCGHQILEVRLLRQEQALVARASSAMGCDAYLAGLKKHRSLHKIACCSLDGLPFANGSFDLVTLNMVAEHLPHPEAVFAELARIVNHEGLLVVHTPNASGYEPVLSRIGSKLLPKVWLYRIIRFLEHREPEDVFPTFYRANTREHLRELIHANGLVEQQTSLLTGRPLFYFFAPFCVLELLLRRLLSACGCREVMAATILGVYRRTAHCESSPEAGRATS